MDIEWLRPAAFLGSILFALIGVVVFWISFIVIDKLTPQGQAPQGGLGDVGSLLGSLLGGQR